MHQHMGAGHSSSLVKPFHMVCVAAVINNDNIFKACLYQTLHNAEKLLVGVQRGQNDRYIGFIILHVSTSYHSTNRLGSMP